jgi:hypothetical protein
VDGTTTVAGAGRRLRVGDLVDAVVVGSDGVDLRAEMAETAETAETAEVVR